MGTADKHDPWALLREARVSVFHDHEYARIFGTEIEPAVAAVPKLADLLARIDAALAAHRDEVPAQDSAKDDVEWHGAEAATQTATLPNGEVWVYPAASVNYFWCVRRIVNGQERRDVGSAMTVAEAKEAAIVAARGMR